MALPSAAELSARIVEDRKAAAATLATAGGEALIRLLVAEYAAHLTPGLGATSDATAYRVALRDVLDFVRALTKEQLHV